MASTIDIESLRARILPTYVHKYTERDVSLYAISVGCKRDGELHTMYERHPDFAPLPTFAIVCAHFGLYGMPLASWIPGADPAKGVHGEQYLELMGPLPTSGSAVTKTQLLDVQDKGKGAVVIVRTTTHDQTSGRTLAINEFTIFMLGAGGFGGKWECPPRSAAATAANVCPSRAPDAVLSELIGLDQAALYRLNGDMNPLHIDGVVANHVGYPKPILHGLCSMAVSVKLVVQAMRGGDYGAVRRTKVRMSSHVFPGETLVVEMWKDGPDNVIFRTSTKERGGKAVITGAAVEFWPKSKI